MKQAEIEENIAKYTIKDSVFSDLFKMKKYLLQLSRKPPNGGIFLTTTRSSDAWMC